MTIPVVALENGRWLAAGSVRQRNALSTRLAAGGHLQRLRYPARVLAPSRVLARGMPQVPRADWMSMLGCLPQPEGDPLTPTRPLAACLEPRCAGRATHRGRCEQHDRERRRERFARNRQDLYGSPKWVAASREFLKANPTCCDCGKSSACTDHSEAHRGHSGAFWNPANFRARCWSCHSRKTVKHDGGFGRPLKPLDSIG
jgi:5-methylcytosine-specific restriction endonuclease McrA